VPQRIAAVDGLAENLRLQDQVAESMKNYRHVRGALSLETIEAQPVFEGDLVSGIEAEEKNRAKTIIEDFMIAANGVAARFLASKGSPSIRRVVRTPKDGTASSRSPPRRFAPSGCPRRRRPGGIPHGRAGGRSSALPDLSLAVIKLLGPGEYVAEVPGEDAPGHFGLAVRTTATPQHPTAGSPIW
jgi:exoribonuclease-2